MASTSAGDSQEPRARMINGYNLGREKHTEGVRKKRKHTRATGGAPHGGPAPLPPERAQGEPALVFGIEVPARAMHGAHAYTTTCEFTLLGSSWRAASFGVWRVSALCFSPAPATHKSAALSLSFSSSVRLILSYPRCDSTRPYLLRLSARRPGGVRLRIATDC